jgi:hypothetical protein
LGKTILSLHHVTCRGQPDKLQWVDCIALGSLGGIGDTASAVLAVSRRSGSIELLSPLTGTLLGSIDPAPTTIQGIGSSKQQQEDAVRVRGLHLLWHDGSSGINGNESSAESPLSSVLSVTEGGTVRVHTPAAGCRGTWEQQLSWQVPADVCCTAYDAASGRLAVGCKGAELRLFDCATGELVFAFKGGKPNMGAERLAVRGLSAFDTIYSSISCWALIFWSDAVSCQLLSTSILALLPSHPYLQWA